MLEFFSFLLSNQQLNIVFDGDSLTKGEVNAGIDQYYPNEVLDLIGGIFSNVSFASFGVDGQSTLEMISDASTQIDPLVDSDKINVIVAWEDVNAILNDGTTAQENFDDMETYFSGRKTAGYDVGIILTGYYPRIPLNQPQWPARISIQKDYFDLVKNSSGQSWDTHIDLRDAPTIGGTEGQAVDGVYFFDSVHLNAIGYDIVANEVFEVLNNI